MSVSCSTRAGRNTRNLLRRRGQSSYRVLSGGVETADADLEALDREIREEFRATATIHSPLLTIDHKHDRERIYLGGIETLGRER